MLGLTQGVMAVAAKCDHSVRVDLRQRGDAISPRGER